MQSVSWVGYGPIMTTRGLRKRVRGGVRNQAPYRSDGLRAGKRELTTARGIAPMTAHNADRFPCLPKTERRYNDFPGYLRRRFGCRVQKIAIDAGFSCPNRDGTLSRSGCIYCDAKGSGTGAGLKGESISNQIRRAKTYLKRRYKAERFIAYFQAFTNTYAPCDVLKKRYDEALADQDIVGVSIGTRPDSIDEARLDLIGRYTKTHMVWMEYGLQTMHDRTLAKINRGHSFEDFLWAVRMTKDRNILICAHVILGLPGESRHDVLDTADALADLGINGVKIHSLYVLKGTSLERLYREGGYSPLELQTYVEWVVAFLERLPADVMVQRLTGDPDPTALVAPEWTLHKHQTLALVRQYMLERDTWQGKLISACP